MAEESMMLRLAGFVFIAFQFSLGAACAQANDSDARMNALQRENALLRKQVGALREQVRGNKPPAAAAAGEAPASRPVMAAQASMPAKAPVIAAASSWTGAYAGLALGMQASDVVGNVTDTNSTSRCGVPGGGGLANGCVFDVPLGSTAFKVSPYVGYNYQFAPQWLAGVEADFGWANAKNRVLGMTGPGAITVSGSGLDSFSAETKWDASIRGRLGFLATPTTLVYATGGAAWIRLDTNSTCDTTAPNGQCGPFSPFAPAVVTDSTTKAGWTVGGGIEAALYSNWVLRGEYRFSDYGHISQTDTRSFPAGAAVNFPNGLTESNTNDVRLRTHAAMFGLAYKFGDPILDPALAGPPPGLSYKAAWSAPRPSWTGFYLGGDVGLRAVQDDPSVQSTIFVSPLNPGVPVDDLPSCHSQSSHCFLDQNANGLAFRFAPHLGYNWQFARDWVAGIEGDVGLGNQKTTLSGQAYPASAGFINAGLFFFGDPNYNFSVETRWDASVRARLGYLVSPTTLVYGTAGPEWMNITSTSTCGTVATVALTENCAPGRESPAVISHSTTALGYTIGGGIESMLTANWILRAEYRYANFGNISASDFRSFPIGTSETVNYQLNPSTHTLAMGISYKLPPLGGN
jgi:outer membrane immunogenic protein